MVINKSEYLEEIIKHKSGKDIDVCVMYSGGKDSSFLLYLLKEVYHLRVKAVMVDNGFENSCLWEPMKDFVKKMGVELEIIKPDEKIFNDLFYTLIKYKELFQREKVNHICFICNNLLWATVVNYARENEIPFVASGMSIDQLSSGRRMPLMANKAGNSVAEKSTQKIFYDTYHLMENIDNSRTKKLFEYYQEVYIGNSGVKTIYPFIYHEIPVNTMKEKLIELGWKTPNGKDSKQYVSSGCIIMRKVISELEKLGIITLNEREQAKQMIKKGTLDESQIGFATYDAKGKEVDLTDSIFEEIGIKDTIIEECNKINCSYKD